MDKTKLILRGGVTKYKKMQKIGAIWDHTNHRGPYGTIGDHTGPKGTICDYRGPYMIVGDQRRP